MVITVGGEGGGTAARCRGLRAIPAGQVSPELLAAAAAVPGSAIASPGNGHQDGRE